ncbi:MAG: hypothetical protein CMP66_03560 [Flavobacteriales bacterium]|nr:hypothetical protein [Flavobacteriales bacterium]|tara:strand:+ start:1973 stop:2371 length:399 start_codon:yes stop_codon:yes gene_type:complete
MKKILLVLTALTFTNLSYSQADEYIEVSTKNIFGKSEMVLYNDNIDFDDLEYLTIGRNNDNYHWVKYTGAKNVIVIMNDYENDTRELCYKHQSDEKATCEIVDAFASIYNLQAKENIFEVWISKINETPDES